MPFYEEEISTLLRDRASRHLTEETARRADRRVARRLRRYAVDYPWLTPGVALSLAEGGYTPEQAKGIALEDLYAQVEEHPQRVFVKPEKRLKEWVRELDSYLQVRPGAAFDPAVANRALRLPGLSDDEIRDLRRGARKALATGDRVAMNAMLGVITQRSSGFEDPLEARRLMRDPLTAQARSVVETVTGPVSDALRPAVRTTALAANTLYEGTVATLRAVQPDPDAKPWEKLIPFYGRDPVEEIRSIPSQTQGGQALEALIEGRPVDVGSGWLPSYDSETAQAAAAAAREHSPYLVGGHAWTPGRAAAGEFFEPDTTPFTILSGLVDAAVAVTADPTAATARGLGAVARARRVFENVPDAARIVEGIETAEDIATKARLVEQAGGVVGRRPLIRGKNPVWWLYSDGAPVVRKLAEETDPWTIWNATGRRLPVESPTGRRLVQELADATDESQVRQILASELGTSVERIPKYRDGLELRPRYATDMPGGILDLEDVNTAAQMIDDYLVLAKVPVEKRQAIFNQLVRSSGRGDDYAVVDQVFDAFRESLIAAGAKPRDAYELTRFKKELWKGAQQWGVDAMTGDPRPLRLTLPDGTVLDLPGPRWLNERFNQTIEMPDAREVRRLVASPAYRSLVNSDAWAGAVGAADWAVGAWKVMVLLRPAWSIRVIGDELGRIAATGTSPFLHPLSYIALVLGNPDNPRLLRPLERLGRAKTDITGAAWDLGDDYGVGLTNRFADFKGTKKIYLSHFDVVDRADEHWARALVEELYRVSQEPATRRALSQPPEQFLDELWEAPWGKRLRKQMASGRDPGDPWLRVLDERPVSDAYGRAILDQLENLTGGDETLRVALVTGKWEDVPLTKLREATEEAIEKARRYQVEGKGPNYVKIQRHVTRQVGQRENDITKFREGVNWLFDALMTRPSNYLSRSPTFRQRYWEEVAQLAPALGPKARDRLLANLPGANLPVPLEQRIRQALHRAGTDGLRLDAADAILKRRALNHTRDLLYDLHKKSQVMDALRLVVPFGEAWKEILTTWAKIIRDYPQVPRRAQQLVQGAHEAEFDPVTGLPTGDGEGFFRWDPQTRQEVFTYPASGWLTQALTGVPVPLKGPVRNLNLVSQGLPGLGPAVTVPAAWIIPDKPSWDKVREVIFPFGTPEGANPLFQAVEQTMPAWARKIVSSFADPRSDRLFANTVFDVAAYLASTGEYDIQGPNAFTEINRLLTDAKEKAGWLYWIRGVAQATTPSSPGFDFYVEKNENLILLQKLRDDYNEMRDRHGPKEAFVRFLDKYGVENLFATQAKSEPNVVGLETTKEQRDWARRNKDLVERYPTTWALLAPKGTTYDPTAYQAQVADFQRDPLTPEEMVHRANARLAQAIYSRAQERLGGEPFTARERAYLRELRQALREQYPGFPQGYDTEELPNQILELERAAGDPKVRDTPVGKALTLYFQARASANEKAQQAGLASATTAEKAAPLREWLREYADRLIGTYPEFRRAWELLLSNELEDD